MCVANTISYLWLQSDAGLFVSLFHIRLCRVSSSLPSFFLMPICVIRPYLLIIDFLSIFLSVLGKIWGASLPFSLSASFSTILPVIFLSPSVSFTPN